MISSKNDLSQSQTFSDRSFPIRKWWCTGQTEKKVRVWVRERDRIDKYFWWKGERVMIGKNSKEKLLNEPMNGTMCLMEHRIFIINIISSLI
jgi:hypothetical protein